MLDGYVVTCLGAAFSGARECPIRKSDSPGRYSAFRLDTVEARRWALDPARSTTSARC
jgi:hypothetical protein